MMSDRQPFPFTSQLHHDIVDLAFDACLERCGFDISVVEWHEQNQIYVAVLDAWVDWPQPNPAAAEAAEQALRSIAIAGGWDEYLDYDLDCDDESASQI